MTENDLESTATKQTRTRRYIAWLIFVAILYDLFDSYATTLPSVINDLVIADFHVTTDQYAFALGIFSLGTFFALVSQSIADRVGRKPMLFIVFFGIGLSCTLLGFTSNLVEYAIAAFFMYLFFTSDIWPIMIAEDGPKDARTRLVTIVLTFGAAGVLLVTLFRGLFAVQFGWQSVTWFGILAMPVAFLAFTTKETQAFTATNQAKAAGGEAKVKGLWKKPFQGTYRRPFVALMVVAFIVGLNFLFITMGLAYLETERGFSTAQNTNAVIIMTVSAILGYLVTGLLADKIGRRMTYFIFTATLVAGIFVVILGPGNLILVGVFLFGMSIWGVSIISRMFALESFPTDIRGATAGWRTLFYAAGSSGGAFIASALIPTLHLSGVFFIYCIVAIVTIPIIWKFVKETKGCNLAEIT